MVQPRVVASSIASGSEGFVTAGRGHAVLARLGIGIDRSAERQSPLWRSQFVTIATDFRSRALLQLPMLR